MNRFDYVKYDEKATADHVRFKEMFERLELAVGVVLDAPRARALVFTKLEEAYMWIGKAIRDDQINRNGKADLQEERGNE